MSYEESLSQDWLPTANSKRIGPVVETGSLRRTRTYAVRLPGYPQPGSG